MAKQILVVDDNITSLKQIGAQLTSGYEVSLAKSGALALQICKQEKPDLILLDIEMPEMDGFETIKRFKEDPLLSPIPVIFLTGNHDTLTEIRALQSGAMDFITKPANKDILLHRLELHLQFAAYQSSLENTVTELENSIVTSFAELVECKDDNAGVHALRTRTYMELLGRELRAAGTFKGELTEDVLTMIVRAAPLHDVGKVGISDIILLKPGPLSPEEYGEVKKHTLIGAEFLDTVYERTPEQHYLKYARLMAEGHHEHYDGNGYPRGLGGDDIPLCARIMAVINVYSACVTDRVYRKALSPEAAAAIILEGKGTEFDPRIVEVFEKTKDKFLGLEMPQENLVNIRKRENPG
ncbi:MAG: response regulator [Treponema sp.]|jgi:putative two-component system response regulator|nr:response regulator [Treponema sp.]